jgi:hypothetical protein
MIWRYSEPIADRWPFSPIIRHYCSIICDRSGPGRALQSSRSSFFAACEGQQEARAEAVSPAFARAKSFFFLKFFLNVPNGETRIHTGMPCDFAFSDCPKNDHYTDRRTQNMANSAVISARAKAAPTTVLRTVGLSPPAPETI